MKFLEFFKLNKKSKTEIVKMKNPSPEQILFSETALKLISPTVEKFGFKRHITEIENYSTIIIYRKNKQYIKISGSTYPTDYPYSYNIQFGEGDSDDFLEYDWNSIPLWRMKDEIECESESNEFKFPNSKNVVSSLEIANSQLLKYGLGFLKGDLNLFIKVRKEQNLNRKPYKIYSHDESGNYITTDEQKSVEQKKKYS